LEVPQIEGVFVCKIKKWETKMRVLPPELKMGTHAAEIKNAGHGLP